MKGSTTLATRRLPAAIIAAAFALVLALGFSGQAQASQDDGALVAGSAAVSAQEDGESEAPELQPATFWAGAFEGDYVGNYVTSNPEVENIVKIKSSNSKVLRINCHGKSNDLWSYTIKPIKAGKVKVSVTYKVDGANRTISNTFTVKKFPKPIKAITVNGEKVSVPTAKNFSEGQKIYSFVSKSAKVKITPANGWKIDGKLHAAIYDKNTYDGIDSYKSFKNGTSFKFSKTKNAGIDFALVRKNSDGTEDRFSYSINIVREKPVDLRPYRKEINTVYVGYPLNGKKNSGALFYQDNADAKITKVTSSNPRVLKAKCGKFASSLKLTGKKPGKSTVTLQYKYKGQKYTTKATYVVDNPPITSLLVNGKKAKLTDMGWHSLENYKKSSVTLKVTPATGWKISKINYYDDAVGKTKTVENGAKLSISKESYGNWLVTLKNKKSGKTFEYGVYIERQ